MTDAPQIGKNVYNEALRRGRQNTRGAREAIRKMLEDAPGPQTTALLLTKIALAMGNIEAVFTELDEIGRAAKNLK